MEFFPGKTNAVNFNDMPHRRQNILTGEWIQVSPNRNKRPWQGKEEVSDSLDKKNKYDPHCYLCPGNTRVGGRVNKKYDSVYVFDNDFSALLPNIDSERFQNDDLLIAKTEKGICRVICFSPRHDITLPEMSIGQISEVVQLWADQYRELGEKPFISYVQIFENKGEIMGCSNPHPHGQIWAQESIPDEPLKELKSQKKYYELHSSTLLGDYLDLELKLGNRIVTENEDYVALVPFWAFWPFETLMISRRPFGSFSDMTQTEKYSLADIIRKITIKYDNLFQVSFPYSAGFHPAPTDDNPHPEWHFHMHFYPPLLRSATIKKFRVGYEMLANPQRDITAEQSAKILRDQPDIHYKEKQI